MYIQIDNKLITETYWAWKKLMDLSQYKHIRSKKFPLPKGQKKSSKANSVHTIALVSAQ